MNNERIEKLAKEIRIQPDVINKDRILADAADALDKAIAAKAPMAGISIWRMIMHSRITKLAAAAVITIGVVVLATILTKTTSTASAAAVQLLTEASKAVEDVKSIHIRAQMRTLPGENFGFIGLDLDFMPIEMWKKVDDAGVLRWRIEKLQRVIVMDGNSTIMLMKPIYAIKGEGAYPSDCFDAWFGPLMNVDGLLDSAIQKAKNRPDTQLRLLQQVSGSGPESVLEIESKAAGDYTNDYLKNKLIFDSDHKEVYYFDSETKLLKGFEVFVHTDEGEVLVFEVNEIEYNPQIDDSLFTLELPQDVIWLQQPQVLPDNEKYVSMTPKQAAEAFFKACADENWDEYLKFSTQSRVSEKRKEYIGGLEIISIGEPFKSGIYGGWFVPYEIRLRPKEIFVSLSNANTAKRFVMTGEYDANMKRTDETSWQKEPEILIDNVIYAKMTPQEVVRACYTAQLKQNFNEMRKFIPESFVKKLESHFKKAKENRIDMKNLVPIVEIADCFWSEEKSAYLVKCKVTEIRKWNLAIRNDNPAKRWVVDGGF